MDALPPSPPALLRVQQATAGPRCITTVTGLPRRVKIPIPQDPTRVKHEVMAHTVTRCSARIQKMITYASLQVKQRVKLPNGKKGPLGFVIKDADELTVRIPAPGYGYTVPLRAICSGTNVGKNIFRTWRVDYYTVVIGYRGFTAFDGATSSEISLAC